MNTCQWFAKCENQATTTRPGPDLSSPTLWGEIPVCARCAEQIDESTL